MGKPIVYSTPNCFRCKNLKALLEQKKILFTNVFDVDLMERKGITHVPMMEVNGQFLDYDAAVSWAERGIND